jgi:hypothetical protein
MGVLPVEITDDFELQRAGITAADVFQIDAAPGGERPHAGARRRPAVLRPLAPGL